MKIGNLLKFFQPKDKVFFVLFLKVAETLVEMSQTFHQGIQLLNIHDKTLLHKTSDLEHLNDEFTHQIFRELGQNFITPFDREDIYRLAKDLDEIADHIFSAVKYIYLYQIDDKKNFSEFSLLIQKSCLEIKNALENLQDLKNLPEVKESCIRINSIENIADDLQTEMLLKVFEDNDPVRIIKLNSIFDHLEKVTDKAEDVANTLENIVIKYS